MKLKKVVALCRKSKALRLYDQVDGDGVVTQWLGDGGAIYPLHDLPLLDESNLFRMFDVPEKEQEKIRFSHIEMPEGLCVDDFSSGDSMVKDMGVMVSFGGRVLLPLRTNDGILYIQSQYLDPLEDQADFLRLFVRRNRDRAYIVAKVGLLLAGIIMQYDVFAHEGGFPDRLDEIAALTRREVERLKKGTVSVEPVDGDQISLLEQEEGRNHEA